MSQIMVERVLSVRINRTKHSYHGVKELASGHDLGAEPCSRKILGIACYEIVRYGRLRAF